MKYTILLMALSLIASCGKVEKTQSKSYSLSSLQSTGISLYSNNPMIGQRVAIVCSDNGTTVDQKINELRKFIGSMDFNNRNTTGFTTGGVKLTPNEANQLFNNALYALQSANPNSTYCPKQVLATI